MKSAMKKLLNFLVSYKYLIPPDTFERHKFIAGFIKPNKKILDVGGSMSKLPEFTKNCTITTVDVVKPADIIYNGKKIPVKNESYDIVTSIDVLEHINSSDREEFVKELIRVAKELVVISAPLGTDFHLEYEKKTLEYYQKKGVKLPFLEEHVAIGIPRPEQIEGFRKKYGGKTYFAGDVRFTEKLFRIHNFEVKNKYLNFIVFFLKLKFNFLMNIFGYYFLVNKKQSNFTNRFYLVIDKTKSN